MMIIIINLTQTLSLTLTPTLTLNLFLNAVLSNRVKYLFDAVSYVTHESSQPMGKG
jgi:hypothetical protein